MKWHIAALYEMQKLKESGAAGYRKQLDHSRLNVEPFLGMVETEASERLQLSQQHEQALADRADVIFGQEQELAELRKELKQQDEEVARLIKEGEASSQAG
ncbi:MULTISPECIES: hypothetical protein [Paenibacillus]|uniref:hypothetical protein n=1 Tax=Paenibacillus TaxID=44249 RepID=UPI0011A59EE2|nr:MULTISPECIES: hypothetical protein [Paenibacillus]MBJ9993658.1 hypothetical protein [Paenibacillus sp. S28]